MDYEAIAQQVTALLDGAELTPEQADDLCAIVQRRIRHALPESGPGPKLDRNGDMWNVTTEGSWTRVTLNSPGDRGTGIMTPYLGGAAPSDYGIDDPTDPSEVGPFTLMDGSPA